MGGEIWYGRMMMMMTLLLLYAMPDVCSYRSALIESHATNHIAD